MVGRVRAWPARMHVRAGPAKSGPERPKRGQEQPRAAKSRPRWAKSGLGSFKNGQERSKSGSRAILGNLGAVLEPFGNHLGSFLEPWEGPKHGFSIGFLILFENSRF